MWKRSQCHKSAVLVCCERLDGSTKHQSCGGSYVSTVDWKYSHYFPSKHCQVWKKVKFWPDKGTSEMISGVILRNHPTGRMNKVPSNTMRRGLLTCGLSCKFLCTFSHLRAWWGYSDCGKTTEHSGHHRAPNTRPTQTTMTSHSVLQWDKSGCVWMLRWRKIPKI